MGRGVVDGAGEGVAGSLVGEDGVGERLGAEDGVEAGEAGVRGQSRDGDGGGEGEIGGEGAAVGGGGGS